MTLPTNLITIVPKTFYKWQKRFDGKNLRLLEDVDRSPHRKRRRTITPVEEERIVALRRKHIKWGKMKLAKLYTTTYGEKISSWKIQYTIQKYKLYYHPKRNAMTQAKRKRSKEKKRITLLKKKPFPGFLVALDTMIRWIDGQKRYVFTAIDTVSKIAFARMYTTKSSRNAADFLNRMMYLMDHEVWNTGHDNGSEFKKDFQRAVEKLKLDDWWSREHTPKDNPVNERFNGTIDREFLQMGHLTHDTVKFNRELTEWLIEYNFVRPHQALGYETPWEYYMNANKLLPMYSSSTITSLFYIICYDTKVPYKRICIPE